MTIDLSDPNAAWTDIALMNYRRVHFYLVALPDGKVFAVGGTQETGGNGCSDPVLPAEMYDPGNPTAGWVPMATMAEPRMYHSAAVLLPDARILIAGGQHGGPQGNQVQKTAQIFSPPYLFDAGGGLATRPTIDLASANLGPNVIRYEADFTLVTPNAGEIVKVSLVRPGAATHSFDQDQRFVELGFTVCGVNALRVTPPANGNVAPPGYYMLFILDGSGVPSVAQFLELKSQSIASSCSPVVTWVASGSRYVSATPVGDDCPIALRVTGDPNDSRVSCLDKYVQVDGSLGPSPYFQEPFNWQTTFVTGSEIIPSAQYNIVAEGCADVIATSQASETTWIWGDVNDSGVVNLDDILCVVAGFAEDYTNCAFEALDLLPCGPVSNPTINLDDILGVLSAYSGGLYTNICTPPCSPPPPPPNPPSGPAVVISLVVNPSTIMPLGLVTVEVFIDAASNLRGYQLALEVSGGSTGTLTLESMSIDLLHVDANDAFDYVFNGAPSDSADNDISGFQAAWLQSGGMSVGPDKYLGTFKLRASIDAHGTFTIDLRPADTFLRDSNSLPVPWESAGSLQESAECRIVCPQ